jgi:hypothetical protein
MHDLQNMQNMLLLSSTSCALGRSALQCCGGHVRTLSSRNIESVLIRECTARGPELQSQALCRVCRLKSTTFTIGVKEIMTSVQIVDMIQ